MSRIRRSGVVVWAVILCLWAVPLAAQDTPSSSAPPAEETELPEASEVWVGDEAVESPRRVVAMLIRGALQSPENRESWAELADALQELGEVEEAESYSRLLRAAQIADSLALTAELSSAAVGSTTEPLLERAGLAPFLTRVTRGLGEAADGVVVWVSRYDLPLVLTLSALLLTLILMKGWEPWMVRTRSRGRDVAKAGEYLLKEGTCRGVDAAQALWASGLPVHEIARRTGLAQDALAVMLSLQRGPRA